ncbi:MAG: hypothetical protein E3J21_19245, partial [Anaerolineales bacterium]
MVQRTRSGVILLCLICGLLLAVCAQSPTPTFTVTPSPGLKASPTPVPSITPVPVLIVTPAATPTPPSPWPEPLDKVWGTVQVLWEAFRWGVVPILLLAVVVWFGKPYLEKVREKLVEWMIKKAVSVQPLSSLFPERHGKGFTETSRGFQLKATAQIFLSYAREDGEQVENVYQKLSDAG